MRSGVIAKIGLLSGVAVAAAFVSPAEADPATDLAKQTYSRACTLCHGDFGKGDGPLAPHLINGAPDLTKITKRNNGVFPFVEIMKIIDGRKGIAQHGSLEMPAWGDVFREDDLEKSTGRVMLLTLYLHSIQDVK